jgi:coenzyme F420-reducing hydrogenase delta subunit
METSFMNPRDLKTYVFYCSHHLDAGQFAPLCRGQEADVVKAIGLPCSGKIDVPYLTKAFETGADGVVLVTCKQNECRHIEGSRRAHKRAEAVESLLEEIGLGTGRMAVFECEEQGVERVLDNIKQFMERVRTLPQLAARSVAANQPESSVA